MTRPHRTAPRIAHRAARGGARRAAALTAAVRWLLTGIAAVGVASCAGGPIAQNTPRSDPQSFVEGTYSSSYYAPGHRPAAPRVSGTTLTGEPFSLAAARGRVVVINFWGSWCAPCRSEAPRLAALAADFKSAPVMFVGDDVQDSPASARAFEQTFGIGYPSLNDPGEQIALAFHGAVPPAGIPTTLLIDRSGHIAGRVVGEVSYRGLRTLITKVLAGKS